MFCEHGESAMSRIQGQNWTLVSTCVHIDSFFKILNKGENVAFASDQSKCSDNFTESCTVTQFSRLHYIRYTTLIKLIHFHLLISQELHRPFASDKFPQCGDTFFQPKCLVSNAVLESLRIFYLEIILPEK